MKRRIAIGQQEKRIEDQKSRTLEDRKGAPPKNQNRSKAMPPAGPTRLGVILSEVKNLSVLVIAIRKTTERFFASLRMTASRAAAHRNLNSLRFHHLRLGQVFGESQILGCRTLRRSCEGCAFFSRAEHAARDEKTDRNRPAGKANRGSENPHP